MAEASNQVDSLKDTTSALERIIKKVTSEEPSCVICRQKGTLISIQECSNIECYKPRIHEQCLEDFLFFKLKEIRHMGSRSPSQVINCPICRGGLIKISDTARTQILQRTKERNRLLVSHFSTGGQTILFKFILYCKDSNFTYILIESTSCHYKYSSYNKESCDIDLQFYNIEADNILNLNRKLKSVQIQHNQCS